MKPTWKDGLIILLMVITICEYIYIQSLSVKLTRFVDSNVYMNGAINKNAPSVLDELDKGTFK